MEERLEFHVLGGRKGESIVVRLPDGGWGVVDNYTPVLGQPESNPTLRFLRARAVERLEFLCLTHPHEDHYRGLSHLFEVFRPDRVWVFPAKTHRDLVASVLKASAESSNLGEEQVENPDELVRFFDGVRDAYRDRKRATPLDVRRLELGMELLNTAEAPAVRISAIGASAGRALLYEDTLARCFGPRGQFLADRLPAVDHNMISGGLLIEYGQARIVLGGDIDGAAWEETLRRFASDDRLSSQLLKVSHHGSASGYCDGLWQALSPQKATIAVLTPYTSQRLPSRQGLALIASHSKLTLSVSVKATALAASRWTSLADTSFEGLSADVLVTLRSIFPKTIPPNDRLEGRCSFYVGPDGTVIHEEAGEAGRLAGG